MRNFEMYWITNQHHKDVKKARRDHRNLLKKMTLQVFSTIGGLTIVFGVLHWLAALG